MNITLAPSAKNISFSKPSASPSLAFPAIKLEKAKSCGNRPSNPPTPYVYVVMSRSSIVLTPSQPAYFAGTPFFLTITFEFANT